MKNISTFIVCAFLGACSSLTDVTPKDAKDALAQAQTACTVSRIVTDDKTREACEALDAAIKAAREAAEAVVEATE